ncbi:hypothetical protein BDV39DRAFT_211485 [Aspergillus sergii]|uniref:Zn(2)-C6 fungal-type domain-containing protein n=1 Tax=Aspergillus sergii TaxID=1034303 RepID=A0A5N6WLI3_9EURO|nr:hypothetical protein BDV39DRAFT_211485 [Aspergillus sergii]
MDPTTGLMSNDLYVEELMLYPNGATELIEPLAIRDFPPANSTEYFRWAALDESLGSYSSKQPHIDNEALETMWSSVRSQSLTQPSLVPNEGERHSTTTIASDKAPASTARRFRLGRPRRQNHSCDQCRSAKRACDLPLNVAIHERRPSTACSMCNLRQTECTVAWLYRKQTLNQATTTKQAPARSRNLEKRLATRTGNTSATDTPSEGCISPPATSVFIPKASQELTRQLLSRKVRSERLALYVDIVDIPLSQCLRQGSMPPQFSSGIASWGLLAQYPQMTTYFEKAKPWIQSCWDIDYVSSDDWNTAPPHLFRVVSLLDAIFQRKNGRADTAYTESRDTAITETYKWAAIAQAARLFVDRDAGRERNNSDTDVHFGYAHDMARSAWCNAKQLVLRNLATINSFRLALAMVLFGQIVPSESNESLECDETSAYLFFQGVHRFRRLCVGARALLTGLSTPRRCERRVQTGISSAELPRTQLQDLQSDIKGHLLELIGSIEWLVTMLNSIEIATSIEKLGALPVEDYISADDDCQHLNDTPPQWIVSCSREKEAEDSILGVLKVKDQPFTTLWVNGISSETLVQSIRQLAALGVLIWKSLSHLVLLLRALDVDEVDLDVVHERYNSMMTLIQLWRSSFGVLDCTTRSNLQDLHFNLWRLIAFFCIDTDLAVLIFCEVSQTIEGRLLAQSFTPDTSPLLKELQSSSDYCKKEALISAQEVDLISSTCRGLSRPGHQGPTGLKARIQDICAHSSPYMMIRVFKLAAKVFARQAYDDIQISDTKGAVDMSAGLHNCLQTLKVLQGAFVTFM